MPTAKPSHKRETKRLLLPPEEIKNKKERYAVIEAGDTRQLNPAKKINFCSVGAYMYIYTQPTFGTLSGKGDNASQRGSRERLTGCQPTTAESSS